ncbi:MAG: hypothetical protein ACREM8_06595 [Vulcanimicrobiaceae bacterium]
MIHVSVGSPAGTCSVASAPFFRYVVRFSEIGLPLLADERDALALLDAIPNAFEELDESAGRGWRIVPATSLEDWPVLEVTPAHLRRALETARRLLWQHAAPVGISAPEIVSVDEEIEKILTVIARAEVAGFAVNLSYVS